ncbi:MAG: SWIM zinc finger family protein [Gemmataceae bacterium]
MIVQSQYRGRSAILNGLNRSRVGFATNLLREPAFFRGELRDPLRLREGLAAMYGVVVSDFKFRPRDRLAFRVWLEEQDRKYLAGLGVKSAAVAARIAELEGRRQRLDAVRNERLKAFHAARSAFFNYVYESEYELAFLLDPVVTVHPDEISFEAFSRDESTYARLVARHELFGGVEACACGTTNIDFSPKLHGELERLRTYRQTRFTIDRSGLEVATDGDVHQEKKIDLPDSWVAGFLQVHSTMTLGLTRFTLAPVDLFNICRALKRRKPRKSPRALRYEFVPGKRGRAVLEPWEEVIELAGVPVFQGTKPLTVRTWGRQRLLTAARLLPACRRIDVYLAGFGLPSVYLFDLGDLTFTLALSGWTDNDWTGGAKFDLLSRRLDAPPAELMTVYRALKVSRRATDVELATATGLGLEKCRSAASYLCQVGRAMFDLAGNLYRHRDLFAEPFTPQEAAKVVKPAETSPQEKAARAIFEGDNVRLTARRPVAGGYKLTGSAKGADAVRVRPLLHIDLDGKILSAECTCQHYRQHQLTHGPCEHILALRLAHMSRLEAEDQTK